jgi:glycosyltransferase involved in cell wall biosynthesis
MQQEFQQILTQRKGNPEKVNLITNGYDDADFVGQDNPFDGGFHVVHTGLLSEDGNPESCWEALGARYRMDPDFRRKLRITLIGKTDAAVLQSISKNGLDAALNNLGYLPHNLIAAYQRNASLLLLPLRKEPEAKGILTGKFFEYLAAGRPILAFGPEDGDVASILQETQAGKIFDWNARESISKALHELFLAHQNGTPAPWKGKAELIQKYSRKELTARMVELLEWE